MRALLDASQDEILLLSTQGEVLAINKAAERRLARRTGGLHLVGAHLDRLLPRDLAESRMAIVRQVAATATLVHCDVPIRSRWFEFWFYPVLKADTPVSEVAVYAREITQQKKSQADLGKLFQAVQQSPMSVVITDRDGNIEFANPEFTKVTGYTLAEAIGRNPRILKSGHTAPEHYAELWKTIAAGGVWRGELLNKRKNGELFWELASIAPVKEGEKITNFVAVKEDITERKQIEEQLRQSQKMQAKRFCTMNGRRKKFLASQALFAPGTRPRAAGPAHADGALSASEHSRSRDYSGLSRFGGSIDDVQAPICPSSPE